MGTSEPPAAESPAPLVWWEAQPGGLTVAVSGGWTALTGQATEDARGFGWTACVHPADRDRILATRHQANATQQPYAVEYRVRTAAGAYRWVAAVSTPVAHGAYLGMLVDITAQRAREQAPRVAPVAPELVSVPEAARVLGVSAAHLYRLARDPIKPPPFVTRLGRVVRIDLTQLRTFLRQR